MKSFDKQVKDLMKNIQKHVNKEIEKETMKLQTQNQAFLLDTECEELLLEILANDTNFPAVLRNKFSTQTVVKYHIMKTKNFVQKFTNWL